MFGGIAFLLDGKMICGLANEDLMVRVGPERYEAALAEKHVRPMDFTGRPLKGYVYVSPEGARTDRAIQGWVELAAAFVGTLDAPVKKRAKKAAKKNPTKKNPTKKKAAKKRRPAR
jgi:hypothetical protein